MITQTEKYVEISYADLNIDERQLDELAEKGLAMIQNNKKDLVNYAISKMMSDVLYDSEPDAIPKKKIDKLKEKIKLVIEQGEL